MVPGSDTSHTTGDPQIITTTNHPDFGHPTSSSSPLCNRISPLLVPADAEGRPFGTSADVGACRH
jgi:hypothetical protein